MGPLPQYDLVRFPASLASGSESGFQYPYRWGIFLCSPPARTIVAEHGQLSAYWISEHLMKTLARSHFCPLTSFAASTQVLSSSGSQLLPPPDRNFCWREVQVYLSSCRFRFLQCHSTWHPSWAVLVEYWSNWWKACFCESEWLIPMYFDTRFCLGMCFLEIKWRSSSTWLCAALQQLLFYPFLPQERAETGLSIWTGGVLHSLHQSLTRGQ